MTIGDADLVVVGAGPAGLRAAIEGARAGLSVVVVDENATLGGQIFRQLPEAFKVPGGVRLGTEARNGQTLLAELATVSIRYLLGATVWGTFENQILEVVQEGRNLRLRAGVLVLATGAYDRPVPLPGWTLPGVLTVGGAQTILKSQRMIPGRRILMAGTGPLQLVVASQLASAGAEIVAVAEAVGSRALLPHLGALLRAWPIARDGLRYRWNLIKKGVPWVAPAVLVKIDGDEEVERATIATADEDWRPVPGTERSFEVDTVCVGYGLVPSVELARLCGCELRYDAEAAVWVPKRNSDFETTVPGIFAIGDGAGVAGAVVAADEGRIAGSAAALRLGRLSAAETLDRQAGARQRLRSLTAFRAALDSAYRIRPGLHDRMTAETVVCRCEERTRRDLEDAMREGARTIDHAKAWTRCGMGPCAGRMCGLPTAQLMSRIHGVDVASVGYYRPRPPIKPVSIGALVSEV